VSVDRARKDAAALIAAFLDGETVFNATGEEWWEARRALDVLVSELEAAQKGFSPSVRKAFDEQRELWHRKLADADARVAAAEEHTRELLKSLAWFADETNYETGGAGLHSPVQAFGLEAARAAVSATPTPTPTPTKENA
jgi:hypothetical protein